MTLQEQREDALFLLEFPSVLNMLETEVTQDSLNSTLVRGRLLLLLDGFTPRALLHKLVSIGEQTARIKKPLLPSINSVATLLNRPSAYYAPLLNPTGVIGVINDLRAQLKARYEANPARIDLG